ncbi:MAG: hypothetical protein JST89_24340 [Cyanobacteria bacterium SZAS-4]|nr:hypothetical protein [Cyanobacteria bacterium SZAS-4]
MGDTKQFQRRPIAEPPTGDPESYFLIVGAGPMSEAFLRHLIQIYSSKSGITRGVISAVVRPPRVEQWTGPIVLVMPHMYDFAAEQLRPLDHTFHFYRELGSPEQLVPRLDPHIFMCLNLEAYYVAITNEGQKVKLDHPDIQHDLNLREEQAPKTVYGAMMRFIQHHFANGSEPLTFYFTENAQSNPRALFEQFIAAMAWNTSDLQQHFDERVEMVPAMMDRIVPSVTAEQNELFAELFPMPVEVKYAFGEQFGFFALPETKFAPIPWQRELSWYIRMVPPGRMGEFQQLKRWFSILHQLSALVAALSGHDTVDGAAKHPLMPKLSMLTHQEMRLQWNPADDQYVSEIDGRIAKKLGDTPYRVLRDMGSRKAPILLNLIAEYHQNQQALPHSLVLVIAMWLANLESEFLSNEKSYEALRLVGYRIKEWMPTGDAIGFTEIFASLSNATSLAVYQQLATNEQFMQTLAEMIPILARPAGLSAAIDLAFENGWAHVRSTWS